MKSRAKSTSSTAPFAKGNAKSKASEEADPRIEFLNSPVPKAIQPYRAWNPELGSYDLPGSSETVVCDDLVGLVLTMKQEGSSLTARTAAADAICLKCKEGGNDAIDLAAAHGALNAALQLFSQGSSSEDWNPQLACHGADVLWWLADDYDHCQELIRLGGHGALIQVAREKAPNDANVANSVFKVLSNSLYNETRNATLWRAEDISFLIEALAWVLSESSSISADGQWSDVARTATGAICDVAALWLQRADGADVEVVRHIMLVVPRLLVRMGENKNDPVLLQHGCRLLASLSRRCKSWPPEMRESTMVALSQILMQYLSSGNQEIKTFCMMALKALQEETAQAEPQSQQAANSLDGMD
eukprot:gnl/MRDRNA2_/MRDRNA2_185600_c0_seq1.p1 gnl/MRDRNA2_/MRDRNA2_185600_c0~~gnl/MRDRNA2_/MRDRNA2_185600_c0_seq1.p1  ORF type:complete len:360 (+),score=83.05 gnl/MRDRNA2_/MRDRNA2_185600_c0_seq1:87-1166(+)